MKSFFFLPKEQKKMSETNVFDLRVYFRDSNSKQMSKHITYTTYFYVQVMLQCMTRANRLHSITMITAWQSYRNL